MAAKEWMRIIYRDTRPLAAAQIAELLALEVGPRSLEKAGPKRGQATVEAILNNFPVT